MLNKLKATSSKCFSCGDDMHFCPETNALVCPSCKKTTEILASFGMPKHDINEKLTTHKNQELNNQMSDMQCPNCGATTVLNQYQTTANCPYCSTPLIASKSQFSGLKPDCIVPFKFGKEKAEELFKNTLKKKWLAPKGFKNSIKADLISAFYFPSFVFEANSLTHYSGRLYTIESVKDAEGNSNSEKRYFPISGVMPCRHAGQEIEASTHLTQFDLNVVRPYNLQEARVYTDEFVYGFSLEHYSSSVKETNAQAKAIFKQEIRNLILSKYTYDGVDYFEMVPAFTEEKYSYCVLPMYRINYTHKNKSYSNVMNGQTGKLGGKYPKSALKISMIVLGVLAFFAIPLIIFLLGFFG